MASQEHLQMLDDGDSTSTSSSSSDEDDSTSTSSSSSSEDEDDAEDSVDPVAQASVVASEDDDDDDDDDDDSLEGELTRVSAPPKKRIKLHVALATTLKPPSTFSTPDVKTDAKPKIISSLKAKKSPVQGDKKPVLTKKTKFGKKLPTKLNRTSVGGTNKKRVASDEVKAMIVDSDDGGEDDAVAAIVEEVTSKDATPKRRPANPVRPIRLPSMSSPGLLIPPSSGIFRGSSDANGFTTPASVFDHAMSMAGYTTEGRTNKPHRGSSVQRVVGDMFDSNIRFSLHFPKLIPDALLKKGSIENGNQEGKEHSENGDNNETLSQRLTKALDSAVSKPAKAPTEGGTPSEPSRKKRKLLGFSDMVPLSLTLPYPEQYIQKRLEYVKLVDEREKAIIKFQENEEKLEIEQEQKEMSHSSSRSKGDGAAKVKSSVTVPPIPEPPSPPRMNDLGFKDQDIFEDQHPLYPPKGKEQFVAHLDKNCFHVVDGRYFGLRTNSIADPHFVGPNAPGISGLNLSGGTGLATAHTGGGGAAGAASVLAVSAVSAGPTSVAAKSSISSSKAAHKKPSGSSSSSIVGSNGTSHPTVSKKKMNGPTPTASSSELRRIIEEGGEEAEKMRVCIIRAAVHASRSGKHGQSFRGPNGEYYPDVSKAFAAHAGLKPCIRCKNNKQGAYHCRLRRKHKELDYDGSNSPATLAPLFQVPMDELVKS